MKKSKNASTGLSMNGNPSPNLFPLPFVLSSVEGRTAVFQRELANPGKGKPSPVYMRNEPKGSPMNGSNCRLAHGGFGRVFDSCWLLSLSKLRELTMII
jgi:hypothetical protein